MGSGDGPTGKVDDPKVKGGSDKGRVALTDGSLDGLRDEFHAETKKQAAQGGSDRTQVADNTRTSAGGDVQDPYEHVDRVKALRKTLDEIHDGKQPNDPEKVRRLKTEVQTEIQAAKDALKTIDFDKGPDSVKELINKHQMDKVRLAGELKLNPNTVSLDQLKSEFAKAKGDKDRQDKIQALATNLQEREALEMIRHAPAYVKLQEAEMSVLGYNNPRLGINDVPQQGTILKAYDTLKQVGRDDPDFKATSMYSDSEKAIGLMVNGQLSQQVIQNMTWATEAAKPENGGKLTVTIDGKKQTLTQEDFLKRANDTVKNINVGFLTSQAELPDNLTSHASEDMMGIVAMAKTAQLEYASYLSDHGKAD